VWEIRPCRGAHPIGPKLLPTPQSIKIPNLFKDLGPLREPEGTLEMGGPVPESFSVFHISILRGFSERIKGEVLEVFLHED